MQILKDSDFRKELKTCPAKGYLFFGEEDYLKSHAVGQARELLCPDESFAFFNDLRIDGLDYTPQKLQDALMPLPMMADRKLITIKGLNFNTMKPSDVDALCEVLATLEEYDYNLLILQVAADGLNAGRLPARPSPLFSQLAEYLTPVCFEHCTTAKLSAWVSKHFLHNGIAASPSLCTLLPEYCGHSMFVLANEIDKLSFYVASHGREEATEEDMRSVCTPSVEYGIYDFANTIMEGNTEKALAILADYRLRRVEPLLILGDVTKVIYDMITVQAMTAEGTPLPDICNAFKPPLHDFKVKLYQKSLRGTSKKRLMQLLDACADADAALKRSAKGYAPLEKLICTF